MCLYNLYTWKVKKGTFDDDNFKCKKDRYRKEGEKIESWMERGAGCILYYVNVIPFGIYCGLGICVWIYLSVL